MKLFSRMFTSIQVDYIVMFIRIAVGIMLIFSSLMKFLDLPSFISALEKFKLLNDNNINFFAYLVPAVEAILGLLLVFNIKSYIVSQMTTLLLSLFTAVITSKIIEGENLSCGCFGNLSNGKIDIITVYRNLIFIILCTLVTAYHSPEVNSGQTAKMAKNKFAAFVNSKLFVNIKNSFYMTMVFFLCMQTVIFSLQNKELKNRLSMLTIDKEVLQEGEAASSFTAKDLKGNDVSFNFSHQKQKTLLFMMSTTCGSCKVNSPNWVNITDTFKDKPINIFAVTMDSLKEAVKYHNENKINYNVYSTTDISFKLKYRGWLTPQTILIDENGKVVKSWVGILNEIKVDQLVNSLKHSIHVN